MVTQTEAYVCALMTTGRNCMLYMLSSWPQLNAYSKITIMYLLTDMHLLQWSMWNTLQINPSFFSQWKRKGPSEKEKHEQAEVATSGKISE